MCGVVLAALGELDVALVYNGRNLAEVSDVRTALLEALGD